METWWWHYTCSTVGDNPYLVALKKIGHLYLSGMWLTVASRTDNLKACVLKETGLHAH